jgi:hypothetical protein
MGARNRVGIEVLYRPARLYRLAESIPGLPQNVKILELEHTSYISKVIGIWILRNMKMLSIFWIY